MSSHSCTSYPCPICMPQMYIPIPPVNYGLPYWGVIPPCHFHHCPCHYYHCLPQPGDTKNASN